MIAIITWSYIENKCNMYNLGVRADITIDNDDKL
jgi:hypothetical protein